MRAALVLLLIWLPSVFAGVSEFASTGGGVWTFITGDATWTSPWDDEFHHDMEQTNNAQFLDVAGPRDMTIKPTKATGAQQEIGGTNGNGRIENVIELDGISARLQMTNNLGHTIATNDWIHGCLSAWIWIDNDDGQLNPVFAMTDNVDYDAGKLSEVSVYCDMRTTSDRLQAAVWLNGTNAWRIVTPDGSLDSHVGQWTHLAIAHDGVEPTVYFNGATQALTYLTDNDRTKWIAHAYDSQQPVDIMSIGAYVYNGDTIASAFHGKIDDVRITTNALSLAQVNTLMNNTIPTTNNIESRTTIPLDPTKLLEMLFDSTIPTWFYGGVRHYVSDFGAVTDHEAPARVDNALEFDFSLTGTNQYIIRSKEDDAVGNVNFDMTNGTFSFWFKGTYDKAQCLWHQGRQGQDNPHFLIGVGPWAGALTDEIIYLSKQPEVGGMEYRMGYTTSNRDEVFDGGWHHIVAIFNGIAGETQIWLDATNRAVTVGTGADTGRPYDLGAGGTAIQIGQAWSDIGPVSGRVDKVEVFTYPFTAEQVTNLFNEGR